MKEFFEPEEVECSEQGMFLLSLLTKNSKKRVGRVKPNDDFSNNNFSTLLDIWIKNSEFNEEVDEGKIMNEWKDIVGDLCSKYTKVIEYKGTTLKVQVTNNKFRTQLEILRPQIIEKTRSHLKRDDLNIIFI